jgi:hypothetical protein
MSNFQTTIKALQAPAVAGDFASQNPRASVLAAQGQLVAPAGGLIVGNFFFINPADGSTHQAYAEGYQVAFLARESQGLITTFLAGASLVVPQGFMVTGYNEGDFYATFAAAGPVAGSPVYASTTDGSAQVASEGGVLTNFTLMNEPLAGELGIISSRSFA